MEHRHTLSHVIVSRGPLSIIVATLGMNLEKYEAGFFIYKYAPLGRRRKWYLKHDAECATVLIYAKPAS